MQQKLEQLKTEAQDKLTFVKDITELEKFIVEYFGRQSGKLNFILRSLKSLKEQERRTLGSKANEIKIELWKQIDLKRYQLQNQSKQELIDMTISGEESTLGHVHPITQVRREVEKIFRQMGFAVVFGPEIETDYYNFEALNMPQEHPARDMWDTFYINNKYQKTNNKLLLRTHISPVQVRIMEKQKPPFAIISSGRVYRREATDARHEHSYDYTEGFLVGENISFANLKSTLVNLFQSLFGKNVEIKISSSYFPFTEPSMELLMSCIFCSSKGGRDNKTSCSVCGSTGWLEMLGAGMIHPKVFEYVGYPKGKYSGFAFGIGVSRVAMLKYNIPDIRMFAENDQRFLNQF